MTARRPQDRRAWAGVAVAAALALWLAATLAIVLAQGDGRGLRLAAADLRAVTFTLQQSLVSALLSVALAVPVARALSRRRFPGRAALIALMGAPFILPVVVATLGLLAIFGRNGALNHLLALMGLPGISIYGFQGVVLAHVFLNLPLAVRMILQGWAGIPAERFRLATSLGFDARAVRRHLEWPMLRAILPGAFLAIFTVCLTSFAVALTLGGGPAATTIELAIYQAFRFEGDLSRAAQLSAVQLALGAGAVAAARLVTLDFAIGAGLGRALPPRPEAATLPLRLADSAWLAAAALFLLAPLAQVVAAGLPGLPALPGSVWGAAGRSLAVAGGATALALALAWPLARAVVLAPRPLAGLVEAAGMLPMVASSLVMGSALYLLLWPLTDPVALALPVTAVVNGLTALPFALRILTPPMRRLHADHDRLAASLGLRGTARLRWLDLPRLRRPLGFAAGLTAALSMGDLGAIALFADPARATLPAVVQGLAGTYQTGTAAAAALLLLALSLVLFWGFDRWGRGHAEA